MKKIQKTSSNKKTKKELEEPDSGLTQNDTRNNNGICTWNCERFLSSALLSIRWKITGSLSVIDDNFYDFVKLLRN
jgi:hypothetical protein